MKYLKTLRFSFIPLFFLTTCHGTWPFYPDTNNPGLSRFTSRGYNIASSYINGRPYVNNGSYYPLLQKDSSGNAVDTLQFQWDLYSRDSKNMTAGYKNISFLLQVPASFNKTNFIAFNGQRFLNSVPFTIQDTSLNTLSGIGTLYFVSVTEDLSYSNEKYIKLSGLFDGNIGDSISITKGRFDFEIQENSLNF
ncbi:MAG: hypothetical protein ABI374_10455 [Ginsengibacter sp.]